MNPFLKSLFFLVSITYMLSVILLLFFPENAHLITSDSRKSGDLYQMAKVLLFKEALPESTPPAVTSDPKFADILIMGDSFMNVSIGYPIIPDQISSISGLRVHNYNMQGAGESWRIVDPIQYLTQNEVSFSQRPRVLILETVDRGISMRYEKSVAESQPSKSATSSSSSQRSNAVTLPKLVVDDVSYNNSHIATRGWAIDESNASAVQKVNIYINENEIATISEFTERGDVVDYFANEDWRFSGFALNQRIALRPGIHQLKIVATSADSGESTYRKWLVVLPDLFLINPSVQDILENRIATGNEAIKDFLRKMDYLLLNNPPVFFLSELVATTNFLLRGEISDLTPRYSLDPNLLFYTDEVQFVEQSQTKQSVNVIANNIKHFKKVLSEKYNIHLIFMIMPNKYTIYSKTSDNDSSNFLDDLTNHLRNECVTVINPTKALINLNEFPYAGSDTHLNAIGATIVTNEIVEALLESPVATLSAHTEYEMSNP